MIEVNDIVKRYGATVAVNHVSFKVDRGEILGFLGPNGAGKSTTMKILTCFIVADEGKVTVEGQDVLEQSLEVRRRIGYLPENTPLYSDMRVQDYLEFVAQVRKVPVAEKRIRFDRVIQATGIERMLKKNIGHLSKGYRQRVGLAQALLHDPPILILDEPTSGLDPHQIIEIRELIKNLGKTKTIVFSSHILQEISAICTRIIIIKDGRLIADGTPNDLQDRVTGGRVYRVRVQGPSEAVRGRLSSAEGVESARLIKEADGFGEYHVQARNGKDLGPEIFKAVKDSGWTLASLDQMGSNLEDVYLQLTK
jgi:gliding motility-associated transport system ATP-binding protein